MFGIRSNKNSFSYTTTTSLRNKSSEPLNQKMKFSSFSSQEKKPVKKRMIFLIVLLILVSAFILYHGSGSSVKTIIIDENQIESINGK
ncbi:MAG: hypothetical protein R6V47_02105 [Candidatus Delongbacteria bacterium]